MSRAKGGRIHILALTAFLLAVALLLSCQPSQPVATPKADETPAGKAAATAAPTKAVERPVKGGTLRVVLWQDPNSLDPQAVTAMMPPNSIYDLLIQPDADGNITKEGLARDWTISGDGKSITLKLQPGVKFHDGTALDAAAVKWNIERMKDPPYKSPYQSNYYAVSSLDVVDPSTIRFNLTQPDPLLITRQSTQGGMMVSPAAVQKLGQDFPRKPVGSGPFQFVEWMPGDHITLKRFEGYWRKDKDGVQLPYLDQVLYRVITDPSTALANLRTGQIDLYPSMTTAGATAEQWAVLRNDPNLAVLLKPTAGVGGIVSMNTKRPPFENKPLRQAVALALDRQGLAASKGEVATAHASVLNPLTWAYNGKAGAYPVRDLAKAKAKMAEAGYPSGGVKVKYLSQPGPANVQQAEIVKANLAEIGIEVEIEVVAAAVWYAKYAVVGGDYQISTGAVPISMNDVGHHFGLFFHSKGTRNYTGPYSNPGVDELIDKAGSIYDQKERAVLYQQASDIIAEDAPWVPGWVSNTATSMNKKVRNYSIDVLSTIGFGGVWLAP